MKLNKVLKKASTFLNSFHSFKMHSHFSCTIWFHLKHTNCQYNKQTETQQNNVINKELFCFHMYTQLLTGNKKIMSYIKMVTRKYVLHFTIHTADQLRNNNSGLYEVYLQTKLQNNVLSKKSHSTCQSPNINLDKRRKTYTF